MTDDQSTAQDEFKEAGVYSDHETNRGKLICCAQLKEPWPIVCIKAKHTEAKRHGEEKLSTLQ